MPPARPINDPTITANGVLRPTQVEIHLARLRANLEAIRRHVSPAEVMAVLKANANKAEVIIRGRRYPQVGRICMDQIMVNIEWGTAYNGDEVILIGESGDQSVSVEDLAEWAGTIPYEVLTNIDTRVSRVYRE